MDGTKRWHRCQIFTVCPSIFRITLLHCVKNIKSFSKIELNTQNTYCFWSSPAVSIHGREALPDYGVFRLTKQLQEGEIAHCYECVKGAFYPE